MEEIDFREREMNVTAMRGGVDLIATVSAAAAAQRDDTDGDDVVIVCETNQACSALISDEPNSLKEDGSEAVCYAEGYAVKEMFQMCDVTSESSRRRRVVVVVVVSKNGLTKNECARS